MEWASLYSASSSAASLRRLERRERPENLSRLGWEMGVSVREYAGGERDAGRETRTEERNWNKTEGRDWEREAGTRETSGTGSVEW